MWYDGEDDPTPDDDAVAAIEARVLWERLVAPMGDRVTRDKLVNFFFDFRRTIEPDLALDEIRAAMDADSI